MAADALEPLKLTWEGRSRSGNGDAGSGKVGLDFTKPVKPRPDSGKNCCLLPDTWREKEQEPWQKVSSVSCTDPVPEMSRIGGGKSGDREPDVEIRRRWKKRGKPEASRYRGVGSSMRIRMSWLPVVAWTTS